MDVVNLHRASCTPLPTNQLQLSDVWVSQTPAPSLGDYPGRVKLWQHGKVHDWCNGVGVGDDGVCE